jgi:hypothetical protein
MEKLHHWYEIIRRLQPVYLIILLTLLVLFFQSVGYFVDKYFMGVAAENAKGLRIMGGDGLKPSDPLINTKVEEMRIQDTLPPSAEYKPLMEIKILDPKASQVQQTAPDAEAQNKAP